MLKEEKSNRNLRLAGTLVILVLVLFGLVKVVFLPGDILARYTNDDTCYYLGIARNLVAGNGLSYDGLHRTNGFHPLWLGICSLPFLFGAGTFVAWRILMAISVLIWGLGLIFARRVVRRRFGEYGALFALIIFAWPQLINNCTSGMEVTLTFTLVFVAFEVADRGGVLKLEGTRGAELGLGVLLALIFLSRLDAFFLHVAAFVYLLASHRRHGPGYAKGWRDLAGRALRIFGPSLLALTGFLLWNSISFGHLMPISGALKSSFPKPTLMLNQILLYRELGIFAIVALVWVTLKRREMDPGPKILSWCFFGQLLYLLLFLKWAPFAYYMVAFGLPVIVLSVGHFFGRTLERRVKLRKVFLVAAVVAVLGGQVISGTRFKYGFQQSSYRAALWVAENIDEDAVFAMRDCGIFGYFSERSCINLDGLVNDYHYQREVSADRLGGYFEEEGVDYIVHHALPTADEDEYEELEIIIPGRLYGGQSVIALRRDDEIYRSTPYHYGYSSLLLTLAIWRAG